MAKRILVIRFSALGDVAMTVPVIHAVLEQHPDLEMVVLTRPAFRELFGNHPRLQVVGADLKGKHKGFAGLYRLFREMNRNHSVDAVADLHRVLRTSILRFFFFWKFIPISVIDKGRKEKKALTRRENKAFRQLPTSFERYAAVFQKLGYPVQLKNEPLTGKPNREEMVYKVGVAPFAQHAGKMYPAEKMEHVLELLHQYPDIQLMMFGGGKKELDQMNEWKSRFPRIEIVAGKYGLGEEINIMKGIDVMLSMDSANMHLASLAETPVVSVWGATHPYAGFYGWRQQPENAVQVNLFCRPCSVFGNKPCYRGDLACMHSIAPETIVKQVLKTIRYGNGESREN